nr:MAG TPA: ATP P2X receptor [Caudoviricetes sp.]
MTTAKKGRRRKRIVKCVKIKSPQLGALFFCLLKIIFLYIIYMILK